MTEENAEILEKYKDIAVTIKKYYNIFKLIL